MTTVQPRSCSGTNNKSNNNYRKDLANSLTDSCPNVSLVKYVEIVRSLEHAGNRSLPCGREDQDLTRIS